MSNNFIEEYRVNLSLNLGVEDEDLIRILEDKSTKAGFLKKGFGAKVRRKCETNKNVYYEMTDAVIDKRKEQHSDEEYPKNPLVAIQGWFYANGTKCHGVLLVYSDVTLLIHVRFGSTFGLTGFALTHKDIINVMELDLSKLCKQNPLDSSGIFDYLHYGRYAFYVYSPLEVTYGLIIANKFVNNEEIVINAEDIINTVKNISL